MAGLTAHALTCVKRDRVLFADLSFTLPAGSLTYLRGPNGAGKTSLLRLLTGLSLPDQGEILLRRAGPPHAPSTQALVFGDIGVFEYLASSDDYYAWWMDHGAENWTSSQP